MNNFEKNFQNEVQIIAPFEDVRGKDLSSVDMRPISSEVLITTDFDTETRWPDSEKLPTGFNPEEVLENGKNPGLMLRELHEQGIDGRGITVAIIDQKLDVHHPEYRHALTKYEEYGGAKKEPVSMHGPAVASLLVGEKCGVAPGASLVYMALPSGRNFSLQAQALENIIAHNKKSTVGERVRVVSCSIGYRTEKPEPGLQEWIDVLKKAKESGIFVVDVGGEQVGIPFTGCGNSGDKEDAEHYEPWLGEKEKTEHVAIPCDYRTVASSWKSKDQYMYTGKGGMSWSVPYLAGLFVLALQVNPNLNEHEFAEGVEKTSTMNKNGLRVVNPPEIIRWVREKKH